MTWAFLTVSHGHDDMIPTPPHNNFVVIAPMIMKFETGMKLDAFYKMETKNCDVNLLLRNYDVITCILANSQA